MQIETVRQILDFCLTPKPVKDYRLLFCLTSIFKAYGGYEGDGVSTIDDVLLMLGMAKNEIYADGTDCSERKMVESLAEVIDGILKLEIKTDWIVFSGCQDFVKDKYRLSGKEYPYVSCNDASDMNIRFMMNNADSYGCKSIILENGIITYYLKPLENRTVLSETFVYCFKEKDSLNVKFGYSTCIDQRVDSIQAANGDKIECVGFFAGTLKQEQDLHNLLRKVTKRSEGGSEWYKLSNKTVKTIYKMFKNSESYSIEDVLLQACSALTFSG